MMFPGFIPSRKSMSSVGCAFGLLYDGIPKNISLMLIHRTELPSYGFLLEA